MNCKALNISMCRFCEIDIVPGYNGYYGCIIEIYNNAFKSNEYNWRTFMQGNKSIYKDYNHNIHLRIALAAYYPEELERFDKLAILL